MSVLGACSCGDPKPHVVARRTTADGFRIALWCDGAVTDAVGTGLPGVPIARPRTPDAVAASRAAGWLFVGIAELYDLAELPALYDAARKSSDRSNMHRRLAAADEPGLVPLDWQVYETDRDGQSVVRVAALPRMRWPGLVVWHERGRYELLAVRTGHALGARSREAAFSTGVSFATQRDLFAHLRSVCALKAARS